MYYNTVHNKLVKFAPQSISLSEFQDLLEESTKSNPIRVEWETLEGNRDYYWMWWDEGAYVGDDASETKEAEGMFNIQTYEKGSWRTLTLQTVSKCRYNGKVYIVD